MSTSSEFQLTTLPPNGQWQRLGEKMALLLPVKAGESLPSLSLMLRSNTPQSLGVALLGSLRDGNFTPDQQYDECRIEVNGEQQYACAFSWRSERDQYLFLAFEANEQVEIALTDSHLPGLMTVFNSLNARVAKHTRQTVDGDYGVDEFDFWLPRRRPMQIMPALSFSQPLRCFAADNLLNGHLRPEQQTNAWVPAADDNQPTITWRWPQPVAIHTLTLVQDNDFDNAMETVQMGHTAAVTPHCITHYRLWAGETLLAEVTHNHQSVCTHRLAREAVTDTIRLEIVSTAGALPAVYSLNVN